MGLGLGSALPHYFARYQENKTQVHFCWVKQFARSFKRGCKRLLKHPIQIYLVHCIQVLSESCIGPCFLASPAGLNRIFNTVYYSSRTSEHYNLIFFVLQGLCKHSESSAFHAVIVHAWQLVLWSFISNCIASTHSVNLSYLCLYS